MPIADTAALLVCAGNATRMGGIHKILHPLAGVPVLLHGLRTLCGCPSLCACVVVCRAQDHDAFAQLLASVELPLPVRLVIGGETRQQSVHNGFLQVPEQATYVAMHDGARPLVRMTDVEAVIHDAHVFGAATLGVPVKDTIKIVEDGLVVDTPYRPSLFQTQTPQVFRRTLYQEAMAFAEKHALDCTDDCQLVEALGVRVAMTTGSYSNLKLTTPEDFAIAEALLQHEKGADTHE